MNTNNLGMPLLALFLIAGGLFPLLNINFTASDVFLAVLAIAAGVFILLDKIKIKFRTNLGMLLLAIWLVLRGLLVLTSLSFSGIDIIMALLAIAAGVLLLLKK